MVFLSLGLGPQFLSHKAAISNILLFLCLKEHNFQSLSCHNTCEMFLQPLWPTLQPQNISRRDLQIVMVINVVCCINVSLMSRHMLCFLLYVVCCVVLSFWTVYSSVARFMKMSRPKKKILITYSIFNINTQQFHINVVQ